MNDPEIRSESDFQSESWSTTTVYDAVYEKNNTENEVVNGVQGGFIEEHGDMTEVEEVNEEYDGDYEEYMPQNKNMRVVQTHENAIEVEVYEEYDGDYEEYMPRNQNMRVVQTHENAIEEEVYEEYDGDYQEYMSRNATYSNKSKSITQKFLMKKILVILVLLIVCTVGIVVGLSVHFTTPTPTTTVDTTSSRSITTAAASFETVSARGTLFSIKLNKLNAH